MDALKICAVGIITAFCVLVLRDSKSEIAVIVGVVGGCVILLMLLDYLGDIFGVISDLSERSGIDGKLLKTTLKIVGVGYITEFSAGIAEDAGSKSVSEKMIFAGKIIITALSMPVIVSIFELVAALLK